MKRYGDEGRGCGGSRAASTTAASTERERKTVSAETTFSEDIAAFKPLEKILWSLSERVSGRLKARDRRLDRDAQAQDGGFRLRTRARTLATDAARGAHLRSRARSARARDRRHAFRLIGIGTSNLVEGEKADAADLVDHQGERAAKAEHAIDKVREKFGNAAVVKGLVFDGANAETDDDDEETTTSRPR